MTLNKAHNHEVNVHRNELQDLRALIIQEAIKYPMERARSVFNRVVREHPLRSQISFIEVENLIASRRSKIVPKVPADLEEFLRLLEASPTYSRYFQREVRIEGELCAFIFSNGKLMQKLGEADSIQFDGTFFTVPKIFNTREGGQLFTIFFNIGHHTFPGLSVLMKRRTEIHYNAVFSTAQELIPNFNPTDGIADF